MASAAPRTRYCSRCLTTFVNDPDRCTNLGCRGVRPQAGWGELLDTGDLIDRTYRIHQRLAIGGAGVTYLVRETHDDGKETGPPLAVKVLYQQRDQGPYLRRLATEAQILQGLNHPQIVEYRGFVHRSGHSPYLVTRFEEGGSLLDHLRRNGALPVAAVANIGRQVLWALDKAHGQGVVHRDLKPENVLLVQPVGRDVVPECKVADFGIAKVYGGVGDRLTRVGAFVGTPQYAAPEQFDGLTPEPAADVYAVGAMLYFCLTLRPVAEFPDGLDPETCHEILAKALPPRLDLPDAPANLRGWMQDTLAMAMTLEPTDRCDVTTLDERLANIAAGRDPGPPPRRVFTPAAPPDVRPTTTADAVITASGHTSPGLSSRASRPPPRSSGGSQGGLLEMPSAGGSYGAVTASDAEPPPPARGSVVGRTTPQRTLTLDNLPEPARRTMGCGLIGMGGAVAIAVLAVAGWLLWGIATSARVVTPGDPEWLPLATELGKQGAAAQRLCQQQNPNARRLQVALTVDGAGRVQQVDLENYAHEPTRACMQREIAKARFPRTVADTVKVAVRLSE